MTLQRRSTAVDTWNPAANAARLASTPTPPRRIASSNCAREKGSAPVAASAPNNGALMTLPVSWRDAREVLPHERSRGRLARLDEPRRVDPPIPAIRSLRHRIDPMRRRDQRRAIRRHEPALNRASALHQLGGDHDVELPGHRHECEHWRLPGRQRRRLREDLAIVDRRTCALRDARYGCLLPEMTGMLRQIDDPIRQNAATLSPHCENGDRDRRWRPRHDGREVRREYPHPDGCFHGVSRVCS